MILRPLHLTWATDDPEPIARLLQQRGYVHRFTDKGLPNAEGKHPFMCRPHPTHDITLFGHDAALDVEVVVYPSLAPEPGWLDSPGPVCTAFLCTHAGQDMDATRSDYMDAGTAFDLAVNGQDLRIAIGRRWTGELVELVEWVR